MDKKKQKVMDQWAVLNAKACKAICTELRALGFKIDEKVQPKKTKLAYESVNYEMGALPPIDDYF